MQTVHHVNDLLTTFLCVCPTYKMIHFYMSHSFWVCIFLIVFIYLFILFIYFIYYYYFFFCSGCVHVCGGHFVLPL